MPRSSTKPKCSTLSDFIVNSKLTENGWVYIYDLSQVVVLKYFHKYFNSFDKDDLIQLGVSDCASFLIKLENSELEIRNIRNILFTRIRNTVSNYIFRSSKMISTEDTLMDLNIVTPFENEDSEDLCYNTENLIFNNVDELRSTTLNSWKIYLEFHSMKKPCDLISINNTYDESDIETLASVLDSTSDSNYFTTLHGLLGDLFLVFLDIFQEDRFKIPSTILVKKKLEYIKIYKDSKHMSVADLASKYSKSETSILKILELMNTEIPDNYKD